MLSRNLVRYISIRQSSSVGVTPAVVPKYPPILDLSENAKIVREREQYRDKINCLDSIEEKLFYPNLQHYYGTRCYILNEGNYPVNFLPFAQYVTRTRSVEVDDKQFYQLLKFNVNQAKELLERIRPHLQEALLFELMGRNREHADVLDGVNVTGGLIERVNDVLLSSLSMQYQHLLDATVDYNPRVEAFWLAGDFHPSAELFKEREKEKKRLIKENKSPVRIKPFPVNIDLEKPVEHHIQYISRPLLQLRSQVPLQQLDTNLIGENEKDFESFLSDTYYSPSLQYGLEETRRHGINIPGCWPGDESAFGLVSYHHLKDVKDVPENMIAEETKSRMTTQAILNGFSWLYSQAALQGFSTYSELTYPLTTQQVITDGRRFSFNLYQLNTTIIHKVLNSPNTRTNICISLPSIPLYQEIKDNQFVGWNDSAVLTLLAFYLNKPEIREGVDLQPYVNPATKVMGDIDDEARRNWLHNQFRHMYSNRPRHRLPYEIYDWERIYKITFKTKQMDARMRPFERDQNPTEERKYWDSLPPYIPKKFRPKKKHWTGWRAKFAKTYFPEP